MGIFKNIFNNKQNQTPVNDPIFDYIVNYVSSDDFDVDDAGAENLSSDLFSITNRIASDLASKRILSNNSYLSDILNNKINQYTSAHDFWVSIVMNMLLQGDGIALIETNNSNGTVSGFQILPSAEVTILQDSKGLSYRYHNTTYPSDKILDFRYAPINSLHGSNPLRALKETLKLSRASNQLLNEYLTDTATNKTLLQADGKLSADDKERLKEAFQKSIGSNRAGGCLVSDDSVKITSLPATNVGAETVKQLKANDSFKKAIASVYGVPYELLGVVNSHSNGSDILSRYRFDLQKYVSIIESELNRKLTGTYEISNPIQPLNASDVANLVKSGVINSAEAKQYLGFE